MAWWGCDISNHQGGTDINAFIRETDFLLFKATEGLNFTDSWCDIWVQACRAQGHPWGFYHFARNNDPVAEADFFIDSCINYFGEGIPVLDWEDGQSVAWVNTFVERVHERTQVWPWIYANPWRFQQGGVNANCGRWVASYPGGNPQPSDAPAADGVPVCCWQYTSTPYDCNYFYGDLAAWQAYARGEREGGTDVITQEDVQTIARAVWEYTYDNSENCFNALHLGSREIRRIDDPTGRDVQSTTHEHVKWIAGAINGDEETPGIRERVEALNARLDELSLMLDDIKALIVEDYPEDE